MSEGSKISPEETGIENAIPNSFVRYDLEGSGLSDEQIHEREKELSRDFDGTVSQGAYAIKINTGKLNDTQSIEMTNLRYGFKKTINIEELDELTQQRVRAISALTRREFQQYNKFRLENPANDIDFRTWVGRQRMEIEQSINEQRDLSKGLENLAYQTNDFEDEKLVLTRKEYEGRDISKLYVLIHPLFLGPRAGYASQVFTEETQRLYDNSVRNFIPTDESEVLLFIPYVEEGITKWKKEVKSYRDALENNLRTHHWVGLYKACKKSSTFPNNVILGENIVNFGIDADLLEARLEKRGFKISSGTQIIVGGEFLNDCLADGVDKLLRLPQVISIKVDKRAVLAYGYSSNDAKEIGERDFLMFTETYAELKAYRQGLELRNYKVEENQDFITISKA